MKQIHILWVDDEIDLLQPHILFLEEKGYRLDTATNGEDAIKLVHQHNFDLIFLDENMPGISGLETMTKIKSVNPGLPIVMITKSEEEDIMDEAIGGRIDDYLIKPVNPKQILLSIKKNIDTKRLVTERTTSAYQAEFAQIGMLINTAYHFFYCSESQFCHNLTKLLSKFPENADAHASKGIILLRLGRNEEAEAEFWSENRPDLRLMDAAVAASSESAESVTITLRMDPRMLARIKRLARSRFLNYQSMIKQWLSERMEQEIGER